jgi:hypothetical protein
MPRPQACIASLFRVARRRVVFCTNITPTGNTYAPNIPGFHQQRWVLGLDNLLSWVPWPAVYWILDTCVDNPSRYQGFFVATRRRSFLPPIDPSPVLIDFSLTATEKHARSLRS